VPAWDSQWNCEEMEAMWDGASQLWMPGRLRVHGLPYPSFCPVSLQHFNFRSWWLCRWMPIWKRSGLVPYLSGWGHRKRGLGGGQGGPAHNKDMPSFRIFFSASCSTHNIFISNIGLHTCKHIFFTQCQNPLASTAGSPVASCTLWAQDPPAFWLRKWGFSKNGWCKLSAKEAWESGPALSPSCDAAAAKPGVHKQYCLCCWPSGSPVLEADGLLLLCVYAICVLSFDGPSSWSGCYVYYRWLEPCYYNLTMSTIVLPNCWTLTIVL